MINVLSMPFIDTDTTLVEPEKLTPRLIYQYIPFIKYGLILLGAILIYFLLVRPIINTMRGEVQKHNKTVEQLEKEQSKIQEEEMIPLPPVDDAITTLKKEVLHNHIPTTFIVKNWIQEG